MSKHDCFFDRLRRAPKKRCSRRCRRKFTLPAGYTRPVCPPYLKCESAG